MSRMSLAPILRQTLRKTSSVILSLIIGLSGLAAAAPLMSGTALADSYDVCATGCTYSDIQTAVNSAVAGATVTIAPGTYTLSSTLSLPRSIILAGAGKGTTVINAASVGGYGVHTNADGVTIENLSIVGPINSSGYGLKIEGSVPGGRPAASNIVVTNVAVSGSYRTGIDLNGINGATLTNVSSTGAAHGNGIALTDSHDVTLDGVSTSSNAWGGIALYATGSYYSCGVDDITLTGANSLGDVAALYTGLDNTSNPDCTITYLHLSGLPYMVALNNNDPQDVYTTSLSNAGLVASLYSGLSPVISNASDSSSLWVAPGQTIQSVVNAAHAGDTVNVPSGTYNETVTVGKKLTILGAQAGVAAADTGTGNPRSGIESTVSKFYITASNVTVDGFTLSNSDSSGQVQVLSTSTLSDITVENNIFSGYSSVGLSTYNAGNVKVQGNYFGNPAANSEAMQIRAGASSAHGCNGSQVLNNVFDAATNNGGADVNFSCTGSDSSGVTVSGNTSSGTSGGSSFTAFSGVDGNITISDNTAATDGSPVFFFGNVSGSATITGNTFSSSLGSVIAIYGGEYTSDTPNTGSFTISNNPLLAGVHSIKITSNGLASGGSLTVSGNNLTGDSSTAIVNNSAIAVDAGGNWWGNALGPDSSFYSGGVNVSSWCSVSGCSATQTASSGSTSLPSGPISTPTVNGSTSSVTIPPTNSVVATTSTADGTVQVKIPAGTTVTADSSVWDGTIQTPTVTSVSLGSNKTVSLAIEVGAGNTSLTFSKAVKLVLPGQANKLAGFVRNGIFTAITTSCNDYLPNIDTNMPTGGNCIVSDDGSGNLVIWTKHFTTFVAYSPAASPTSSSTSSNSSASTGSRSSNPTTSGDTGSSSEVLGASSVPTTTPSTSSATTTQPSSAEAFQPPSGGNNKFLGIAWYIWLIGIAGVALASYIAYAYLSVDRK